MSSEDLTDIKISTARIEEQIKALVSSTSLQHKNLSEQMGRLASKDDLEDHAGRLDKLESAQGWVIKSVIGAAITAVAAASGITKKFGL